MVVWQEKGGTRLPLLLMSAGGVALVAALAFVLFGGEDKAADTSIESRCAFPACRAAFDPGAGRGYEGASVAVNPEDENHMVVTDANMAAGWCMWHTTFDRGKEWVDGIFSSPGYTGCHINSAAGGHVPTGPGGVAFGPSGKVYAAYGSATPSQGTRESVIVGVSDDGGKKFTTTIAAKPPGDDLSYAKPLLSVVAGPSGKDRLLLSFWQCRQGGRFCESAMFARSDDGGATFTPPVVVNDNPAGQSPSEPLQTPDGMLYVTFARRYSDGPTDLILARSRDSGQTWNHVLMDQQIQIGDRYDPAKLAFDPRSNTLYTTYTDARANTQQVFFRTSKDQGQTWTPPVGIAPDAQAATSGFSRTPSMSVAPNGRIDIVYYRTPQANADNVFWAYSIDGGAKWVNRQVNDQLIERYAFHNAIGTWYPPDVFSLDTAAVITWSDTRNAREQNRDAQEVLLRRMIPAGADIPP